MTTTLNWVFISVSITSLVFFFFGLLRGLKIGSVKELQPEITNLFEEKDYDGNGDNVMFIEKLANLLTRYTKNHLKK